MLCSRRLVLNELSNEPIVLENKEAPDKNISKLQYIKFWERVIRKTNNERLLEFYITQNLPEMYIPKDFIVLCLIIDELQMRGYVFESWDGRPRKLGKEFVKHVLNDLEYCFYRNILDFIDQE